LSVFYLLPPPSELGDRLAHFLQAVFPGLDWDYAARESLTEVLTAAAGRHADVYVVFRDDLPEGEDPARALIDGFGAEPGDEVVEVGGAAAADGPGPRRWRVGAAPRRRAG
jgi:hypothetical protein